MTSFDLRALRERLRAAGAKPQHERLVLRAWLAGRELDFHRTTREHPFPRALLEALPAIGRELDAVARTASEHPGEDGSSRLLLQLHDGQTIESVLLPRDGVCVSTQVGCAVGCVFCMTGKSGLLRQLTSLEILVQVVLARRRRALKRVVFMGMGEPSHNLAAVLETLSMLGGEGGFAHKNLVFSTVGDANVFERLAQHEVKPALALSLHTTHAKLREELLPRAPKIEPAELVQLADDYARRVGHPIQYQWTLIEGVNDGDDELARLTELMRGKHGIVNFIPYNEIEGESFRRPSLARARAMSQHLHQQRILCKLRRSAGQDVDGACGQLRARHSSAVSASVARKRASTTITVEPQR
jgi:23S rRNA (adenine2503-C2)-methyltransferase